MTPSKWDGLLDEARTGTHQQCAPKPRRGPTIIALTLLALIVAGGAGPGGGSQPLESSVTVLPLIATVFCTAPYSAMPIMT